VQGVGGIANVELVAHDEGKGEWVKRRFSECPIYELLSLAGNINEDGLHAHVVVSGSDFNAFGGHLQSAEVSVFWEFFIMPTEFIGKTKTIVAGAEFRKIDLEKKE